MSPLELGLLGLSAVMLIGGGAAVGVALGRREVPAVRGHYPDVPTYLRALKRAYEATDLPRGEPIILAVTHSAFATGAWAEGGPRVFNNNIGVIRSTAGWPGAFARMGTDEVVDGARVHLRGQAFRAYDSLEDSARDAVRLWRTNRYRPAYELLVAGDPAWSGELGRRGYYTASPEVFESAYRNRLQRVKAALGVA